MMITMGGGADATDEDFYEFIRWSNKTAYMDEVSEAFRELIENWKQD